MSGEYLVGPKRITNRKMLYRLLRLLLALDVLQDKDLYVMEHDIHTSDRYGRGPYSVTPSKI